MGYVFFTVMLALAIMLIPFSGAAAAGASEGAMLFFKELFPSLFPFLVCADYVFGSGIISLGKFKRNGFLILACSLLTAVCGTPSAAVLCSGLSSNNAHGVKTASRLCAAMNQAGPMFILAALSEAMLGSRQLAVMFALSHYLPALAASFIIGRRLGDASVAECDPIADPWSLFADSISKAVMTLIRVCGTVIFFRIVYSLLCSTGLLAHLGQSIKGLLTGCAEMTNGLAVLSSVPSRINVSICAFLLSFGGLCIFVQSKLIFAGLQAFEYFKIKLLLGIISFAAAYLLYPLFSASAPVFGNMSTESVFDPIKIRRTAVIACSLAVTAFSLCTMLLLSKAVSKK